MKKKLFISLSYIAVAMLSCVLTLYMVQREIPSTKLIMLEKLILEYSPDEMDRTKLEDAAARGMIEGTGIRWNYYIPASEYQVHQESVSNIYVGIGVTVRQDSKQVISVVPGGPAAQAGMLPGDQIVEVDGEKAESLSFEKLVERIKGEAGTQVMVTVRREGEMLPLTVTRNPVETAVAIGRLIEGRVGYVRIKNFSTRSAQETIEAIQSLVDQGAESLLFDVRFNGGGYEDELIKILDYLLPEGPLMTNRGMGKEQVFSSDANCVELPMAVLINEDTYSAAELFAAVLQEYGVAKTVGEHTVGKGYYQYEFSLGDGSAACISVGKYSTSQDKNLEGVGLTPDVEIMLSEEDYARLYYGQLDQQEDPQLQAAVALLK